MSRRTEVIPKGGGNSRSPTRAVEALSSYLRARIEASASVSASAGAGAAVIRRYALGPTPVVRDLRTGKKSTNLERVLSGRIEMFLDSTT